MRSALVTHTMALLLALAPACAQIVVPARAGLLYYGYGDVRIDGVLPEASYALSDGQTAATGQGRAEFLLGSGAVLWLGHNSQVRFDSTALADTRVTVIAGQAILELVKLPKEAGIQVNGEAPRRDGIYLYGDPSPEFRRWAALRSYELFTQRGRRPRNWAIIDNRLARHEGFREEFAAISPHLFYAIDFRAGLLSYAEGRTSARAPSFLPLDTPFVTIEAAAEIFLGRGITLRLAPQSAMRLLNSDPAHPAFVLDRGSAMLEVAESARGIPLRAQVANVLVEPKRNGIYLLDHGAESLLVYLGEARATLTDRSARRTSSHTSMDARSSQRLNLATLAAPTRFDTKQRDLFFAWCAERSLMLYFVGAGYLGDWKPPINHLVGHKVFGTRREYDGRIRSIGNLEATWRAALQQAPF